MSRRDRLLALLEKLRANPKTVAFEDLDRALTLSGFESRNNASSHYVYRRPGCPLFTVPRHRPVKAVYVRKAIEHIERYGDLDED